MANPKQSSGGSLGRTSQILIQMMTQLASRMEAIQTSHLAERENNWQQIQHLRDDLANIRTTQPTPLSTIPEQVPPSSTP
jgi:hypothetical protein